LNKHVREEDALEYAMRQCGLSFLNVYDVLDRADFISWFVEWYFSGEWTLQDDEQE